MEDFPLLMGTGKFKNGEHKREGPLTPISECKSCPMLMAVLLRNIFISIWKTVWCLACPSSSLGVWILLGPNQHLPMA